MLQSLAGLIRSLRIYRNRAHLDSLTRFCGEVAPDANLVFDVGAHVGDRISAFRRKGARVLALEPQRLLAGWLRARFALDRNVTIIQAAAGAAEGHATMLVNRSNPTVTSLSEGFVEGTEGAEGWEGQDWDGRAETRLTTLDRLIARHGVPDFIKIDAEGYEAEVLRGLTREVPALSFEVTMVARAAGQAALTEAIRLGFTRYRLSLGESHVWETDWMDAAETQVLIDTLPDAANSGDIFARR